MENNLLTDDLYIELKKNDVMTYQCYNNPSTPLVDIFILGLPFRASPQGFLKRVS